MVIFLNTIIFRNSIELPKHIKEFMAFYDKPVFIYPKLLPVKTFDIGLKTCAIGPSEEKYLYKLIIIYITL